MIATGEKYYLKAATVREAIILAQQHADNFRYIAGGTDVLVNKAQGNETAQHLIDLTGISGLNAIEVSDNVLEVGSLVTIDVISKHPQIREHFPALAEAAHAVASPVLRKTATIGGNLLCENRCVFYNQSEWWREAAGYCLKCNGDICIATGGRKNCFSKFVSDTAPVLISLDAQVELVTEEGVSVIPLENIYTGDGVVPRNLSPFAIIRAIRLPLEPKYSCVFHKLRPRESVDFTSLSTAVSVCNGQIKIVLGGVDPKPVIITGRVTDHLPELIVKAIKKPRVIDNDYYSRAYRKEMIGVFLQRSFKELKL